MVSATRCNKIDIIVCRCRACPNSNADLLSIDGDDDGRLRIPPLSLPLLTFLLFFSTSTPYTLATGRRPGPRQARPLAGPRCCPLHRALRVRCQGCSAGPAPVRPRDGRCRAAAGEAAAGHGGLRRQGRGGGGGGRCPGESRRRCRCGCLGEATARRSRRRRRWRSFSRCSSCCCYCCCCRHFFLYSPAPSPTAVHLLGLPSGTAPATAQPALHPLRAAEVVRGQE